MADIQIHTEHASAKNVLSEAVQAEKNRISYALQLGDPSNLHLPGTVTVQECLIFTYLCL